MRSSGLIFATVWVAWSSSGCVDDGGDDVGRLCEAGSPLLEPAGWSTAHQINFQAQCDCLSYKTTVEYISEEIHNAVREVSGRFCTEPCDDYRDCTRQSTCAEIFPESAGLPERVEKRYCVPNCLVNGCPAEEVCTPPSREESTEWYCVPG